jgi:hypothetical protein
MMFGQWWPAFKRINVIEAEAEEASCWLLTAEKQPKGRPEHPRALTQRILSQRKRAEAAQPRRDPVPGEWTEEVKRDFQRAREEASGRKQPAPVDPEMEAFELEEFGQKLTAEKRREMPDWSRQFVAWKDRRRRAASG